MLDTPHLPLSPLSIILLCAWEGDPCGLFHGPPCPLDFSWFGGDRRVKWRYLFAWLPPNWVTGGLHPFSKDRVLDRPLLKLLQLHLLFLPYPLKLPCANDHLLFLTKPCYTLLYFRKNPFIKIFSFKCLVNTYIAP